MAEDEDYLFHGVEVAPHWTEVQRHLYCARLGLGRSIFFHRKSAIRLLWDQKDFVWHRWVDRALLSFCSSDWVTWTGPAASGKSANASLFALAYWLEKPDAT